MEGIEIQRRKKLLELSIRSDDTVQRQVTDWKDRALKDHQRALDNGKELIKVSPGFPYIMLLPIVTLLSNVK